MGLSDLLLPLATVWEGVASWRARVYTGNVLPGYCISIGNLSVGGTGKSPLILDIAALLLKSGKKVAIVSRGYRSGLKKGEFLVYVDGRIILSKFTGNPVADEALMYSKKLAGVPVIVGARRYDACQRFLAKYPKVDYFLLDDAYQHHQLHRDLNVVLLDARQSPSRQRVLPAGRLREGWPALQRADVIYWTRCTEFAPSTVDQDFVRKYSSAPQEKIYIKSSWPQKLPGKELTAANLPVLLALGIADPDDVKQQLEEQGVVIAETYFVADHAKFKRETMLARSRFCRAVVCSEKDYYRQSELFADLPLPSFVVPLKLFWEKSKFLDLIA